MGSKDTKDWKCTGAVPNFQVQREPVEFWRDSWGSNDLQKFSANNADANHCVAGCGSKSQTSLKFKPQSNSLLGRQTRVKQISFPAIRDMILRTFPQSADVYAGAICGYLKMGNSQDHGMFWTDPHCIGNFHLNYSPNYSVRAEPHSLIGSCQPGSTWCLIIQTALLWCMVPPCMEFLPRLQPPLLGPAQEPNPVKGVIGPSRSAHQIISQRTAIPRQRLVAQGKQRWCGSSRRWCDSAALLRCGAALLVVTSDHGKRAEKLCVPFCNLLDGFVSSKLESICFT